MRLFSILILLFISENCFSQKKSNDYYITKSNDTIYGEIKASELGTKFYYINDLGEKIKITRKTKDIIEIKSNGYHYYHKKKIRVGFGGRKKAFLKLIVDGEAKLYEYKILAATGMDFPHPQSSVQINFYIERNNELDLINFHRFYYIIKRFLPENKILLAKIKDHKLGYGDVKYVVNYFNTNFNEQLPTKN